MSYVKPYQSAFFIFVATLLIFAFTTNISSAYFTTKQEAVLLDSNAILFTIDYQFGVKKYDIIMPVFAKNSREESQNFVSYSILNSKNEIVEGSTTGIVFSKAKLTKGGTYNIQKETAKTSTLAVIFTPKEKVAEETYRLQVNYLPFNFGGNIPLKLNPSELQYYTTEPISL